MTNRLKVIIVVGIVAIATTYLLTKTPEQAVDDSSAYEKQLAELRAKQKPVEEQSRTSSYSTLNNDSSAAPTVQDTKPVASGAAAFSEKLGEHMNSTIDTIKNLMPSDSMKRSVEQSAPQERIAYLQSMPVSVIGATPREVATGNARKDAGRADPFGEIAPPHSFPRERHGVLANSLNNNVKGSKILGQGPDGLPPPSADLPPPPPPEATAELNPPPGITSDELPPPPEKPLLMRKLRLNGIVGDHVILAFNDRSFQRRNGYRRYITLAQGQIFDNVKLVDVDRDKAVLEEDGEQRTVRLEPIR
jgi:hypothetical protein